MKIENKIAWVIMAFFCVVHSMSGLIKDIHGGDGDFNYIMSLLFLILAVQFEQREG